ncbi:MAG TPA: galactokinase [Flavisolibacter sp.]|nr:galactokinase [Flavisolibacter sp.]
MAINETIRKKLANDFAREFDQTPFFVRSPGRVNIIGEHTDYNNGFVLPAAIDKAIYVAVAPREDDRICLYSGEFAERVETSLAGMKPSGKVWPNYILGVADQLKKRGYAIKGFNLAIDGDVPIGSGLSSSAAVECATAFALDRIFGLRISKLDLVLIAQKAEHEFAGVLCGIMDQFASAFGKKDHVIRLDCQSLDYEYVPLRLDGYAILLLNSNVKHSLASTGYNDRRAQCEAGVAMVREFEPDVRSLRDVSLEMLERHVAPRDQLIYRRCRYVVEENERLLQGCEDLKKGNVGALGKKMFASHDGLSREYEVSCPELDFLVDAVRNHPDVLGARMMGGGFGGCTINLVREDAIEQLTKEVSAAYKEQLGKELTPYTARIEDGTTLLG